MLMNEGSVRMLNIKVESFKEADGNFVVVRLINGMFWYFGTYKTLEKARKVARQFDNSAIIEKIGNQEERKLAEWKKENA